GDGLPSVHDLSMEKVPPRTCYQDRNPVTYIQDYLNSNRERLALEQYGLEAQMTCVVLTPRFRASSHVLFLVLPKGKSHPVIVAKVPRIPGGSAGLEHEAASLRSVQGLRPDGFDSVPRVVAFEEFRGLPILLETALVGYPMDPPLVRRKLKTCCETASNWLSDLQLSSERQTERNGWFERQVEGSLDYLAKVIPWSWEDRDCLNRTRDLVEPLRTAPLPVVLEHGDFSHPNVMLLNCGQVGVVDWEMADPRGTPGHDLFFFLTYAAFAKANARENGQYVPAIDAAFFGPTAWARRFVLAYADKLHLPQETLAPLFLLCWVRYMAGLLRRLNPSRETLDVDTACWLRQNRYCAAWRHALENFDRLKWLGGPR
ncbi:MAG: aminoglycoside phosphotransferase family protein, partial [Pirellulaceae bacterium]